MDAYTRRRLLAELIDMALRPREQNIVRYHLGLGTSDGKGLIFAELAVYLNYNGLNSTEKIQCGRRKGKSGTRREVSRANALHRLYKTMITDLTLL